MKGEMERLIRDLFEEGSALRREFAAAHASRVLAAASAIEVCLRRGNKVLVFGNGGSAADAQHFAAELVGRFRRERRPLPAVALTTDTSALTAIGNDYGFRDVFARQVQALASDGDVVVGISTSGESPNVVSAVRAARAIGAITIALAGGDGGALAGSVDIALVVPSAQTARVQEVHGAILHILSELLESALFPEARGAAKAATRVANLEELLNMRSEWRAQGKVVVWTNGCFDVLHVGHVHSLRLAKEFGDVLVVGINTDEAVQILKGPGRPILPLDDRMELVAALRSTDHVIALEETTPTSVLERLKPDIHVKGEDYAPPSGKPMPERRVVESYGGRVEYVPLLTGRSTSDILREVVRHLRSDEVGGQRESSP